MKRVLYWSDLAPAQRLDAKRRLANIAFQRAEYCGQLLPWDWEARMAVAATYSVTRTGGIWAVNLPAGAFQNGSVPQTTVADLLASCRERKGTDANGKRFWRIPASGLKTFCDENNKLGGSK
jgi:hypothetical protein